MNKIEPITGGIISSVDLRDYRLNPFDLFYINFPDKYEIDMIHNVKHQNANSCTAHAVSTVLEYFDNNSYRLSTSFIYGLKHKLFNDEGEGETVRDALKIVKDYGDPKYGYCQGDKEVDAVYKIAEDAFNNENCLKDAYKHKIKEYIRLFTKKQIKYALMTYGPVVVCSKWYDSLAVSSTTGNLIFNKTRSFQYHSFVIYGWNDYGWMCQNSWGKGWGKDGLFNLSYNHKLNDVFALIDDDELDSSIKDVKIIKPGKWSVLSDKILRIINKIINKIKIKSALTI